MNKINEVIFNIMNLIVGNGEINYMNVDE